MSLPPGALELLREGVRLAVARYGEAFAGRLELEAGLALLERPRPAPGGHPDPELRAPPFD